MNESIPSPGQNDKTKSRSRKGGKRYAAIDLGTNNCRLLIARPRQDGFQVVDGFSRIVRLGERLSESGELSEAAMQRTIDALKICRGKIKRNGATRVRSVATQACRQARNGREFIRRVWRETGLHLMIVSAEEEARLAVSSCSTLFKPHTRAAVVFDIGGGSTEIVKVSVSQDGKREVDDMISLPLGVITLAEKYGGREVTSTVYNRMIEETGRLVEECDFAARADQIADDQSFQMIGTSGTVTTLAALHLDLPVYERRKVDGLEISSVELASVAQRLRGMTFEERCAHGCIGEERADLVLAGSAILEAIMGFWPAAELSVGDRGLREGILLSMMRRDAQRDFYRKKANRRGHGTHAKK